MSRKCRKENVKDCEGQIRVKKIQCNKKNTQIRRKLESETQKVGKENLIGNKKKERQMAR